MPHTLDAASFNRRGESYLPGLLGVTITAVGDKTLHAELAVRPSHLAPNGYLHAGTVITLADTACGYACVANLPEGANSFTTIEQFCYFGHRIICVQRKVAISLPVSR